MYFSLYFFHFLLLISSLETASIANTSNDGTQVSARQIQATAGTRRNSAKKEKFYQANKHQLPSEKGEAYILTMFPDAKGDHTFNSAGEKEWQIQKNTDTTFVIYGMSTGKQTLVNLFILGENLDGAQLSFTTHDQSCQWERKDRVYVLKVNPADPHDRMSERAYVILNLPDYNSTLYMCITPNGSNEVFHQGNR